MSMPVPVHPDDRLVACQHCRLVFLARPDVFSTSATGNEAVKEHEKNCAAQWLKKPIEAQPNTMHITSSTTSHATSSITVDDIITMG